VSAWFAGLTGPDAGSFGPGFGPAAPGSMPCTTSPPLIASVLSMADSPDPTTAAPRAAGPATLTKAVIPAAGLGTRFLPFTKATPKEMLPVIDTPVIEMIVQEAARAGLTDVLMVTRRGKPSIEDHFDRAHELEEALEAKGDKDGLALIRASAEMASMHYVRQAAPRGLGHAVLCAAEHVGQEPFAVLLGDDLIDPGDPLLQRMLEVRQQHGGIVAAAITSAAVVAPSASARLNSRGASGVIAAAISAR
jgi:bifunctional N-acetylglucosamine-1-phosphate-uridyltransferase/glucosamine-1-phosphate-acetyltransferase GlmU-like protein